MKRLLATTAIVLASCTSAFAAQCVPGCTPPPPEGGTPPPSQGSWWKPTGEAMEWQWYISTSLNLNNEKQMGLNKTAHNGTKPPATNPMVYDIDGFENPKSTVTELHNRGFKVTCYIEVGGAENYRADYDDFPPEALGNNMAGWPGEKWLDIRVPEVVKIIKDRIKMCADKGFDAVEPDLDTSYVERTGFPLTKEDEENYMKDLAHYAHSLGLAMWGKNPDSTGDSFSADMVDVFDAVLTEECNQYNTCGALAPYTKAGKLVFNAEYAISVEKFCTKSNDKTGWMGTRFAVDLNGSKREPCR